MDGVSLFRLGRRDFLERRRAQNLNAGFQKTADRERSTIGRKAQRGEQTAQRKSRQLLVCRDIPEFDFPIHSAGNERLAIRGECHGSDGLDVTLERRSQRAGRQFPQARVIVR